jgi:hypothetical protein
LRLHPDARLISIRELNSDRLEAHLDRGQILASRNPNTSLRISNEVRWHDGELGELGARKGKEDSRGAALSRGQPTHQRWATIAHNIPARKSAAAAVRQGLQYI